MHLFPIKKMQSNFIAFHLPKGWYFSCNLTSGYCHQLGTNRVQCSDHHVVELTLAECADGTLVVFSFRRGYCYDCAEI